MKYEKKFVDTNIRKTIVENMGRKKQFVDRIDEKYVDQNKPANGNVQNKEGICQDRYFRSANININI